MQLACHSVRAARKSRFLAANYRKQSLLSLNRIFGDRKNLPLLGSFLRSSAIRVPHLGPHHDNSLLPQTVSTARRDILVIVERCHASVADCRTFPRYCSRWTHDPPIHNSAPTR
jgi:hypothetical protein